MDELPSNMCRIGNSGCGKLDPPARRDDLVEANVTAWRHLLALGKQVVVVDQVPVAPFDVMPMMMRRRFLGLSPITSFEDLRPATFNRTRYLDDVFAQMPASDHLHRVTLRTEFCTDSHCETMDDRLGVPVLMDTSHFVPAWIEQHGSVFAPFVLSH